MPVCQCLLSVQLKQNQGSLPCVASCQSNVRKNLYVWQEEIAPVEPVPVYTVNPDRMTIPPKSSCQLEFFGFSAQPGQLEEHFVCSLGTGVKLKQTVFDITARCVLLAQHADGTACSYSSEQMQLWKLFAYPLNSCACCMCEHQSVVAVHATRLQLLVPYY